MSFSLFAVGISILVPENFEFQYVPKSEKKGGPHLQLCFSSHSHFLILSIIFHHFPPSLLVCSNFSFSSTFSIVLPFFLASFFPIRLVAKFPVELSLWGTVPLVPTPTPPAACHRHCLLTSVIYSGAHHVIREGALGPRPLGVTKGAPKKERKKREKLKEKEAERKEGAKREKIGKSA